MTTTTRAKPWSREDLILLKKEGREADIPNRTKSAISSMWYKISKIEEEDWDDYIAGAAPAEVIESPNEEDLGRYRGLRSYYQSLSGELPAKHNTKWSEEETRYIVENPEKLTVEGLARKLGRTEGAVNIRLERIKEAGGRSPIQKEFVEWSADKKHLHPLERVFPFCRETKRNFEDVCAALFSSKTYKYTTVAELHKLMRDGKVSPADVMKDAMRDA